MRFCISILFLIVPLIPLTAVAEQWARATYTPDGSSEFYLDIDSLEANGNYRQAWVLLTLRKPDKKMGSLRQFMVFNCGLSKFKVERNECYTGPMMTGRRCGGGTLNEGWESVSPGSNYGLLTNLVCQK